MAAKQRLTWEPPPPYGGLESRIRHGDIARALRRKPGHWVVLKAYQTSRTSASMAGAIRAGKVAAYQPIEAFEVVARTVTVALGKKEHRVYIRYVGKNREYADVGNE